MPKEQVPVWDEKAMENLKGCFDKEGRLLRCPSKPAKKLLVLQYLASKFQPGRRYTEKEVNEILKSWCVEGDYCLFRREMWDNRLLERERDGSAYWLSDGDKSSNKPVF